MHFNMMMLHEDVFVSNKVTLYDSNSNFVTVCYPLQVHVPNLSFYLTE